jgi:hypothetical protein
MRNARRYFGVELEILDEQGFDPAGPAPERTLVVLEVSAKAWSGRFRVAVEPRTDTDLENARRAELLGSAGGMGDLAARCPYVWRLEDDTANGANDVATLNCCALLASVALGPVLPPAGDTLFGVRGARERAERLLKSVPKS